LYCSVVRAREFGVLMALLAIVIGACVPSASPSATPDPLPSAVESAAAAAVPAVLAAGDIAACDSEGDEATAALLDHEDGTILALGDLAYPTGNARDFASCYDPTWGRHRGRTLATPGNHEYETDGAGPYFDYFDAQAGRPGPSWYAVELGDWLLISLDSNCEEVGGCGADSPQSLWLADRLAARPVHECTLAFWHHPRWTSGLGHGSDPRTDSWWRQLYSAGADLVLSGHEHVYERFAPLDADGESEDDGLVQFVVGTGGRSLYEFETILPASAAHDNTSFGILHLTLRPGAYDWEWVPVAGSDSGFTDAGTAECR
jgi:hypothetical protein